MILGPASQLSPALQAVALNGLETFSLAARGLLTWPKEEARIGTRRRRRGPYKKKDYDKEYARLWRMQNGKSRVRGKMTAAILHLAKLKGPKGFTVDELTPAFTRVQVQRYCNFLVTSGKLRSERGKNGRNGSPTIYCAI